MYGIMGNEKYFIGDFLDASLITAKPNSKHRSIANSPHGPHREVREKKRNRGR